MFLPRFATFPLRTRVSTLLILAALTACAALQAQTTSTAPVREPVDYVNPYIGNVSHMLRPTDPTVDLPNGMMRMNPDRIGYTAETIGGFPLLVAAHRGETAFRLRPFEENVDFPPSAPSRYIYDQEKTTPYRYSVYLDQQGTTVTFAPACKSAIYTFGYEVHDFTDHRPHGFDLSVKRGELKAEGQVVSGYEQLGDSETKVYLYLILREKPLIARAFHDERAKPDAETGAIRNTSVLLQWRSAPDMALRYGISYLSVEQAKRNLESEIPDFDLEKVAQAGRQAWNDALGKIRVEGGSDNDKTVFYTALYRIHERMINVSEDGKYYSPFDGQVHDDNGVSFYTDDWIWDTFRAVHPLRILLNPAQESAIVASYVRMAQQSPEGWMPTFPQVTGDRHSMNGKHFVSVIWDAYNKGLRGFDLETAYNACKKTLAEATLCPWMRAPATSLDAVYKDKGFFPALHPGEPETVSTVKPSEKRQAVAVTLAASYDAWCMAQMAHALGKTDDYTAFTKESHNYRHLFNEQTGFFHPKDADGKFIEPFDYRFSGGSGARDYFDENNGWTYRWDVQHNIADLVQLMGGRSKFVQNLDQTFAEDLGRGRPEFYAQLPDASGNVGQFSMGNEPSMHIPYLYNYAGAPWKTQKRVRQLLATWFRNDLMGIPGDEDGGGLSSFVVFSSMGFYPVTPGTNSYNIGSPVFTRVSLDLGNGKTFVVEAKDSSPDNKYIQSARLNGHEWNKPWFTHADLMEGGKLELQMGNRPKTTWGTAPDAAPPSAESMVSVTEKKGE